MPTTPIEGDEVDPVAETVPADAALPATGESDIKADGGAETDGNDAN